MRTSTKRLLMGCVGIVLIVGYIIYEDTHIFEMEWHQYFMIGVLAIFTALNFIRYVIESRIEYYQKWGDTNEGR